MRIDAYAHVVPKQYYEDLGAVYQAYAYSRHPDTAGFWDYERRISHLERYDIDRQVIALGGPHLWPGIDEHADRATITGLMEQANDEVAQIASEYPDYFIPVGTIPVLNDSSLDEAERCLDELDMAGIQIYSNYDGRPVDTEALHPIYELAERRGVPIWIHPQVHDWYDWTEQWGVDLAVGWIFDTSLAMTRLVMSGLMERYSSLDVITHHGGGLIPHFLDRLELFFYDEGTFGKTPEVLEGGYEPLAKPIRDYFEQFYADTVLYGSDPALDTVYQVFGADHLLFATDYPYGGHGGEDFMASNVRTIDNLDITPAEKEKINSGNIRSLIGEQ